MGSGKDLLRPYSYSSAEARQTSNNAYAVSVRSTDVDVVMLLCHYHCPVLYHSSPQQPNVVPHRPLRGVKTTGSKRTKPPDSHSGGKVSSSWWNSSSCTTPTPNETKTTAKKCCPSPGVTLSGCFVVDGFS
ncbi:hypothetical protein ZHAS_00017245 [Anopheles sinensis]|uniref:Uncharacterized protein n=1 Tax=Anopheles sinensis TaxID=74873 RepID=A0A084WFT3_ANOSI|nr:hypothetical protein ZHAS_00017245 [Anopheles sinensis]